MLKAGVNGPDYAKDILALVAGHDLDLSARATVAMAAPVDLEERLAAILNKKGNRNSLSGRAVLITLLFSLSVFFPVAMLKAAPNQRNALDLLKDPASRDSASKPDDEKTNEPIDQYEALPKMGVTINISDGESAFIGTRDGTLQGIDLETGKTLWRSNLDSLSLFSAVIKHDRIYTADTTGRVWCLDPSSGRVLWAWGDSKQPLARDRLARAYLNVHGQSAPKSMDAQSLLDAISSRVQAEPPEQNPPKAPQHVIVFRLQNVKASVIEDLLSHLLIEDTKCVADERTNSLIVSGTKHNIERVKSVIEILDANVVPGVVTGDFDMDGDLDLFLINGKPMQKTKPAPKVELSFSELELNFDLGRNDDDSKANSTETSLVIEISPDVPFERLHKLMNAIETAGFTTVKIKTVEVPSKTAK